MAGIKLNNITKQWGDFIAVNNQSMEIRDKEFMVLLGPSGCGKTTTMRMIAGLETPNAGEIWIGDNQVNDVLPKDRDVAMVFQNYGLYPHMTVANNIAYPLKLRGFDKAEINKLVEEAAAKVELTHLLHRKPKALSGGQRQRVALARALVRRPQVFLMDEPLSNLDAKLRVTMRAELKHLSNELQITTVYVTHDQVEAMTLADRVAVMNDGIIQQLGTPEEIYNNPSNVFVAGFIGSPAMNLIHGRILNSQFLLDDKPILSIQGAQATDCILGIRAEDIKIVDPESALIRCKVYANELLGDAVLVTADIGKERIVIRTDRHARYQIEQQIGLAFDEAHTFFFDGQTGQRINDIKVVF